MLDNVGPRQTWRYLIISDYDRRVSFDNPGQLTDRFLTWLGSFQKKSDVLLQPYAPFLYTVFRLAVDYEKVRVALCIHKDSHIDRNIVLFIFVPWLRRGII